MNAHDPDAPGKAAVQRPQHLEIDAGCSDFRIMRRDRSYYVDKTAHLPDLLRGHGPLLLTRPRRFGKTLTLDTLRCFLELDYTDPGRTALQQELFEGLAILQDPALQECRERCMGQHPVIAVTFNDVEGRNFAQALLKMRDAVAPLYEAAAFRPVLEAAGARLDEDARLILRRYYRLGSLRDPDELEELLPMALPRLCQALHHLYGRSVYVLIDEYDTPLAKAWSAERMPAPDQDPRETAGYYSRMLSLMRGLPLPLLKPDPVMQGSIARCLCTGCTRISRESLFSGANNLIVQGMNHRPTATLMGFTEDEVRTMLEYYGLDEHMDEVRAWYDGYRFAGVRIYNPWSIANYCRDVLDTPGTQAGSYWAHAGVNDELTACLQALPEEGLEQLRRLYEGERVSLELLDFFSYDALLRSPDSKALFALLYHTGFITEDDETEPDGAALPRWRIPNAEVRECFEQQILGFYDFAQTARVRPCRQLLTALLQGDAPAAEQHLTWLLQRFLSFNILGPRSAHHKEITKLIATLHHPRLSKLFEHVSTDLPERVYHLLLFGVLCGMDEPRLISLDMDRELGGGRPDISFVWPPDAGAQPRTGCILEFKAASGTQDDQLLSAADEGLKQIRERDYAAGLYARYRQLEQIWAYGLGCQGKSCAVACELLPPPQR